MPSRSAICRSLLVLILLFAVPSLSHAAPKSDSKPLTNDDVIALVKADLGDEVAIAKIQQTPTHAFDVSTDGLMKLKKEGVSKVVIEAMVKRAGQADSTSSKPSSDTPTQAGAGSKTSQEATKRLSAKLPKLVPMPETKSTQDKGGIKISVAPVDYTLAPGESVRIARANASFGEVFKHHGKTDVFVERTTTPTLKVKPERLRFAVQVNNGLPRVFHGAGLVVQFNVAGKLVAVDSASYSEFANALIPPRGQQPFDVYGPPLDTIPDSCQINFAVYDVVTNTDTAGNVTARQNFEWYFQYSVQTTEQEVAGPTVERLWLPRSEATIGTKNN